MPPSTPPPQPMAPPPVSPQQLLDASEALAAGNAEGNTAADNGTLSNEMMWVIIVAVIVFLLMIGFLAAFLVGKASARKTNTVQVNSGNGRPSLRRQVTPEESYAAAEARMAAVSSASDLPEADDEMEITNVRIGRATASPMALHRQASEAASARVDDVRLIELGMAVERTMALQRQGSEGSYHGPASSSGMIAQMPQTSNEASRLQQKLDGVQAAIDDVNLALATEESLVAARGLPQTIETRIRPQSENDFI